MIQLINKFTGEPLVVGDTVQLQRGEGTYEVLGIPEVSDADAAAKARIVLLSPPIAFDDTGEVIEVLAHDLVKVEWQEDGHPVYYVLRGIYDLLQVPEERMPDCLAELASALSELRRLNTRGVPVPETLIWIDNSRHYVTLSVSGIPHVSVPLTPHDNEVECFRDQDEAETFDSAEDDSPDHLTFDSAYPVKKAVGDPAQEYTERTGRHLSLSERMAERSRVELERARNRGDL